MSTYLQFIDILILSNDPVGNSLLFWGFRSLRVYDGQVYQIYGPF
mgnify:CR=1 FL=1